MWSANTLEDTHYTRDLSLTLFCSGIRVYKSSFNLNRPAAHQSSPSNLTDCSTDLQLAHSVPAQKINHQVTVKITIFIYYILVSILFILLPGLNHQDKHVHK